MFRSGKWLRIGSIWLVVILGLGLIILLFFRQPSNVQQVTVSSLLASVKAYIRHGQVDTLEVASDTLTLTRGTNAIKEVATVNDTFDVTSVLKDNGID